MGRVIVVATGGTIASRRGPSGVLVPTTSDAFAAGLDIDVIELMAVDSSLLTPHDWARIRSAVAVALQRGADGVVITHGTDTLEETALWLELTYDGSAPVVLTGAATGVDANDYDGIKNLKDSLTLAGNPAARDLGVLICFGGAVHPALGTTKIDPSSTRFDSIPARPRDPREYALDGAAMGGEAVDVFGGVDPIGFVADGQFVQRNAKQRPVLMASAPKASPRVDIVCAAYVGADGVVVDAYVKAGARGLVVEAFGECGATPSLIEAVRRARQAEVVVVVCSRTAGASNGMVKHLAGEGALVSRRLRPSQARILLMAALASDAPVAGVISRWG